MWLRRRGYATGMFTEEAHLTGGYGLEAGYDSLFSRRIGTSDEQRTAVNRTLGHAKFLYSDRFRKLLEGLPPLALPLPMVNFAAEAAYKRDVCGDYLLDDWTRWLGARSPDQPFHAFFNFVDGHEPYPELARELPQRALPPRLHEGPPVLSPRRPRPPGPGPLGRRPGRLPSGDHRGGPEGGPPRPEPSPPPGSSTGPGST